MSRSAYLLRRLGMAVLVLIGVMVVTFVVSRVVPSNPAALYAGPHPRPEQVANLEIKLGLDKPLPLQFVRYIGDVLQGDFGESFQSHRLITEDLRVFLPATLELVIGASLLALLIGIPFGVLSGARRSGWLDQATRIISIGGVSIPTFWLGLMLQRVFFGWLGWLPLGGRISNMVTLSHPVETITGLYIIDAAVSGNWIAWKDTLHHLILPTAVLATYPIGLTIRMTRAAMVEVLTEPYIDAARATGLPRRTILFRLALKNAIIPALTVLGLTFAYSITGAFLIELIFSWPGV
ncbi:MAG: ABC transporter permease, partial [Anaerolineaceae bacterium]|nr:ABC transporter permease [Anaerolineaceae bacterium]